MVRPQAIAFFDVDKTVCEGYSGYYVVRELMRRGVIKKRRLLQAVLYKTLGPLVRKMNIRRMYEIAMSDMAGMHLSEVMQIGKAVFEREIHAKIYIQSIAEMNKLKEMGYLIALISSGPYMMIKNFEDVLPVEVSFSNGPEIVDEILQKTIQEPLVYKEGKVEVAQGYAKQFNLKLDQCLFYSDSYADLPLLEAVGGARAVNPDSYLRKEALLRGWPILEFKGTLGSSKQT